MWLKNGKSISDSNYIIAQHFLIFDEANHMDTGSYTCMYHTNSNSGLQITSETGKIFVGGSLTILCTM